MKIEVSINPAGGGTIAINDSIATSYPAVRTLPQDAIVQLEAKPMDGYRFSGWSGDFTGMENPTNMVLDSHIYITANFSPAIHTITLEVDGSGAIKPSIGEHIYDQDSEVEIMAMADKGWSFSGWNGDVEDATSATTTVTVDADKEITAKFDPIMHTVTVDYDYDGRDISTVGSYQYREGTIVDLVATPERGWKFDSWQGDVVDPHAESTTVVMDADKTITASFVRSFPDTRVIGIIVGAAGAGLTAFFITGRKKNEAVSK
jgi:hypothetical protein